MSPASRPELAALHLGDPPEPWEAIGFTVLGGRRIDVGQVALELGARGSGIVAWSLTGIDSAIREVDGLTTRVADDKPRADGAAHPNGAIGVDHVVVLTPDFERTSDALAGAGMPLRR